MVEGGGINPSTHEFSVLHIIKTILKEVQYMAEFRVKDVKELDRNADLFIKSIALAEESKCIMKYKT